MFGFSYILNFSFTNSLLKIEKNYLVLQGRGFIGTTRVGITTYPMNLTWVLPNNNFIVFIVIMTRRLYCRRYWKKIALKPLSKDFEC